MTTQKEANILNAASQVFLRYGYKRTTMGDIAEAAHISRPALYLVFSSKESVFETVMARVFAEQLEQINNGLAKNDSIKSKLIFAFDVWCVRPFAYIQKSPDARDILESSYEFANKTTSKAANDFEVIIADILKTIPSQPHVSLLPNRLAHIMTAALPGFKESVTTVPELKRMISDLIDVVSK